MEFLFCQCREPKSDESVILQKLQFHNDFASTNDQPFTKTEDRKNKFQDDSNYSMTIRSDSDITDLNPLPTTSRILGKMNGPSDVIVCEDWETRRNLFFSNSMSNKQNFMRFRKPKKSTDEGKVVTHLSGAPLSKVMGKLKNKE